MHAGSISFAKKEAMLLVNSLCSHELLLSFVHASNKSLTVLLEVLLVDDDDELHSLVFISSACNCGCLLPKMEVQVCCVARLRGNSGAAYFTLRLVGVNWLSIIIWNKFEILSDSRFSIRLINE